MRAVLDTNEYISALVFGGPPRDILERAERGEFELVVSAHIREEIERVLIDKFKWSRTRVATAINPIWEIAHFVAHGKTISASRDETDNRILEVPSNQVPRLSSPTIKISLSLHRSKEYRSCGLTNPLIAWTAILPRKV
jgi:predicted nucleic acid-binding protein